MRDMCPRAVSRCALENGIVSSYLSWNQHSESYDIHVKRQSVHTSTDHKVPGSVDRNTEIMSHHFDPYGRYLKPARHNIIRYNMVFFV